MDLNTYRLTAHIFDVCLWVVVFSIAFTATFRTNKILLLTKYIKTKAPWLFMDILTPKWERINLKIVGIVFMFSSILVLAVNIYRFLSR